MKIKKMIAGMTLTELIVVFIIVSLFSALAITKYSTVREGFKSKEGYRILFDLYGAQKRYSIENKGNYATLFSQLDVDVRPPKYFFDPVLSDGTLKIPLYSPDVFYLAKIQEKELYLYWLYITPNGKIVCTDGGTNRCSKWGYKYPNQP